LSRQRRRTTSNSSRS